MLRNQALICLPISPKKQVDDLARNISGALPLAPVGKYIQISSLL